MMGNDDWLHNEIIECPKCTGRLEILEHSPFEIGYYLYCDSCTKRVDVSVYDPNYEKIEIMIRQRDPDIIEQENYQDIVLNKISDYIMPCDCGGKFSDKSYRRCLHCNTALEAYGKYMNVWLVGVFKKDEVHNRMRQFILDPEWKNP